jgi:pimeloyl-ACP methyl ester carboxylesterase
MVAVKLLLLHPLPLDGSIFDDDLGLLGECVAPTLYGAGTSIVAWAHAALDAVGDGPVVVVGNSIGGSCAIEVAKLAPTKVKALVLLGTKPAHRPEPGLRDEALELIDAYGLGAAWERYWRPLFGPTASAESVDRAWLSAAAQGPDAVANGVRVFHSRPSRESFLKSWTGPVALVSGEHDIRPERTRELTGHLPEGRFHLIPDVGHYVPLEAPAALTSIVRDVLQR